MAEGNSSGGESKSRSVLSDLTNRIGKRGFSQREKNGGKCFNFNDRDDTKRICISPRPCSEINSLKGNVISGLSKVLSENRNPDLLGFGGGNSASRSSSAVNDVVIGESKFKKLDVGEGNVVPQSVGKLDIFGNVMGDSCNQIECSKDGSNLADKEVARVLNSAVGEADALGRIELDSSNENNCTNLEHSIRKNVVDLAIVGGDEFVQGSSEVQNKEKALISIDTEAEYELGDSFSADTSKTLSETGDDYGKSCDGGEVNKSLGGMDDSNADNIIMSQSGSVDCAFLPQSQESRVFGIDKSTKPKEDECDNLSLGNNSMGDCSCSFCTQAAYIWLDLHHKDIKARVSALKKSQKDAGILAEKSCRNKGNEKHGPESSSKVSKMESHLMHQWRSLFKYMANTWVEESNQLEASLLQLNKLKQKCKAELELVKPKKSEEQ